VTAPLKGVVVRLTLSGKVGQSSTVHRASLFQIPGRPFNADIDPLRSRGATGTNYVT
jgi:hypothetical protein